MGSLDFYFFLLGVYIFYEKIHNIYSWLKRRLAVLFSVMEFFSWMALCVVAMRAFVVVVVVVALVASAGPLWHCVWKLVAPVTLAIPGLFMMY